MKLWIVPSVLNLTARYHSEGSLAVVAPDEQAARALVAEAQAESWADRYPADEPSTLTVTDEEWAEAEVFELAGPAQPKVWLFPDAGCC